MQNHPSLSSSCFAIFKNADDEWQVDVLAALPTALTTTCHGSDGTKVASGGGFDHVGRTFTNDVFLLESMSSEWLVDSNLMSERLSQNAGVMVGDKLICLGGRHDAVGAGGGSKRSFNTFSKLGSNDGIVCQSCMYSGSG